MRSRFQFQLDLGGNAQKPIISTDSESSKKSHIDQASDSETEREMVNQVMRASPRPFRYSIYHKMVDPSGVLRAKPLQFTVETQHAAGAINFHFLCVCSRDEKTVNVNGE